MKKQMKRIFSVMLAFAMVVGLTACGEEVTLSSKQVNGVTIDVPSDFGEFQDSGQMKMAKNEDSSANITVSERIPAQGMKPGDFDEVAYKEQQFSTFTDVSIEKYDNNAACDGVTALYAHATGTSENDVKLDLYNYIIFFDDDTYQSILLAYSSEADTSLKGNADTIMNNIKL